MSILLFKQLQEYYLWFLHDQAHFLFGELNNEVHFTESIGQHQNRWGCTNTERLRINMLSNIQNGVRGLYVRQERCIWFLQAYFCLENWIMKSVIRSQTTTSKPLERLSSNRDVQLWLNQNIGLHPTENQLMWTCDRKIPSHRTLPCPVILRGLLLQTAS